MKSLDFHFGTLHATKIFRRTEEVKTMNTLEKLNKNAQDIIDWDKIRRSALTFTLRRYAREELVRLKTERRYLLEDLTPEEKRLIWNRRTDTAQK